MTIENWLAEVGCSQYSQLFAQRNITLGNLKTLDDLKLQNMGIQDKKERERILKAITAFNKLTFKSSYFFDFYIDGREFDEINERLDKSKIWQLKFADKSVNKSYRKNYNYLLSNHFNRIFVDNLEGTKNKVLKIYTLNRDFLNNQLFKNKEVIFEYQVGTHLFPIQIKSVEMYIAQVGSGILVFEVTSEHFIEQEQIYQLNGSFDILNRLFEDELEKGNGPSHRPCKFFKRNLMFDEASFEKLFLDQNQDIDQQKKNILLQNAKKTEPNSKNKLHSNRYEFDLSKIWTAYQEAPKQQETEFKRLYELLLLHQHRIPKIINVEKTKYKNILSKLKPEQAKAIEAALGKQPESYTLGKQHCLHCREYYKLNLLGLKEYRDEDWYNALIRQLQKTKGDFERERNQFSESFKDGSYFYLSDLIDLFTAEIQQFIPNNEEYDSKELYKLCFQKQDFVDDDAFQQVSERLGSFIVREDTHPLKNNILECPKNIHITASLEGVSVLLNTYSKDKVKDPRLSVIYENHFINMIVILCLLYRNSFEHLKDEISSIPLGSSSNRTGLWHAIKSIALFRFNQIGRGKKKAELSEQLPKINKINLALLDITSDLWVYSVARNQLYNSMFNLLKSTLLLENMRDDLLKENSLLQDYAERIHERKMGVISAQVTYIALPLTVFSGIMGMNIKEYEGLAVSSLLFWQIVFFGTLFFWALYAYASIQYERLRRNT